MKLKDFEIGKVFFGSAGFQWLCTDMGTRTITAIMLEPNKPKFWFKGPPYSVEEVSFDEYDMKSCYTAFNDMLGDRVENAEVSAHPHFLSEDVFKMMKSKDYSYPNKQILKRDRVNDNGLILHPYAAEKKDNCWYIKTFELFSREYSTMRDDEFVKLKFSDENALKLRKASFLQSNP